MFQEHLHIIVMGDLATVARLIHLVGGRSIRIALVFHMYTSLTE